MRRCDSETDRRRAVKPRTTPEHDHHAAISIQKAHRASWSRWTEADYVDVTGGRRSRRGVSAASRTFRSGWPSCEEMRAARKQHMGSTVAASAMTIQRRGTARLEVRE